MSAPASPARDPAADRCCSWQSPDAERAQGAVLIELGEALLLPLVRHVEAAALVAEEKVVDAEHTQPEADLGAQRIEPRVEGLLGNAELGNPHRHDARGAPDKQAD